MPVGSSGFSTRILGKTMRDAARNKERCHRRRTPTQDPSTDLREVVEVELRAVHRAVEVAQPRVQRHDELGAVEDGVQALAADVGGALGHVHVLERLVQVAQQLLQRDDVAACVRDYKGLHAFPSNITRDDPPITRDYPPSLPNITRAVTYLGKSFLCSRAIRLAVAALDEGQRDMRGLGLQGCIDTVQHRHPLRGRAVVGMRLHGDVVAHHIVSTGILG